MLILLALLMVSGAEARLPQVGDHVNIISVQGSDNIGLLGNITDISGSLICLNCTASARLVTNDTTSKEEWFTLPIVKPFDMCISQGSICSLTWV